MQKSVEEKIKEKAQLLGFLHCGIAKANKLVDFDVNLNKYILEKRNASLEYMERNTEKRVDPRLIVENCKTIISVTINYYTKEKQKYSNAPIISKYAYGQDYHTVIKSRLSELLKFIRKEIPNCNGRVFTDSAPIADKEWAMRAGLGWIGKNTLLITPNHGSFVFIGEILIDAELETDKQYTRNLCKNCSKCIDACPTNALIGNGKIDANKCISYHTTANKNENLEELLKPKFKNRVYGCDICQDICPWNTKAKITDVEELKPNHKILELTKEDWENLSEEQYCDIFSNSAVKFIKYRGLKRNIDFLEK